MHRRQFFGVMAAMLTLPGMGALAQERREEPEERPPAERHENPCQRLAREEHELRDQLAHERDGRKRDEMERRIRDLDQQQKRECRR